MANVSFRIPDDLNDRLIDLAGKLDRDRSYLIRMAIEEFLEEKEDYLVAVQRLSDKKDKVISLEDLEKHLGLDDKH